MNRTHKKLSWWWRIPAYVAIAIWITCPAICLTGSTLGGACCPSEVKPKVAAHAAPGDHHHNEGHHHDHGDSHHHGEPVAPTEEPTPATDDACCTDSLLALTANAPAKLLMPDLKPVFGLDAALAETLYTLEHPTILIDQSTPDRSWVFLLQEYCVLPSLPHGPPSLLLS